MDLQVIDYAVAGDDPHCWGQAAKPRRGLVLIAHSGDG